MVTCWTYIPCQLLCVRLVRCHGDEYTCEREGVVTFSELIAYRTRLKYHDNIVMYITSNHPCYINHSFCVVCV